MLSSIDYESPVGCLKLVATAYAMRAVLWPQDADGDRVHLDTLVNGTTPLLDRARREFDAYFSGDAFAFDLPIELVGTEFQRNVWAALAEIPYGSTITYSTLATRLGRPHATRATASAVGRNPLSIVLPCHRVVGSDGALRGFAGGLDAKSWLLDHEKTLATTAAVST